MELKSEVKIPRFYGLYGRVLYEGTDSTADASGKNHFIRQTRYHCAHCHTEFRVSHILRPYMSYYENFGDNYVTCPSCGHRYVSYPNFSEIGYISEMEQDMGASMLPVEMTLALYETRFGYILRAREQVIMMDASERTVIRNQVEEFRFDVKKRTAQWKQYLNGHRYCLKKLDFGNPFDDTLYTVSQLTEIHFQSMAFRDLQRGKGVQVDWELKQKVTGLLRDLREGIQKKWKKVHGYNLGSLFVPAGTTYGALLFPLMNIAWRLSYPDAKNLPKEFSGTYITIRGFKTSHMLEEKDVEVYTDFAAVRAAKGSIPAVIAGFGLPDTPLIRRTLQQDIFTTSELRHVFRIVDSQDYARDIMTRMGWIYQSGRLMRGDNELYYFREVVYDALDQLSDSWPVVDVMRVVRGIKSAKDLHDTLHMLKKLSKDELQKARRVRTRELHDWLVNKMIEIRERGFELPCPESVKRRLQMQLDSGSLKTFLPKHSHELDRASAEFHNCVKTYSRRVLAKECNIILMTDDKGKLLACLEVRDSALVQAKLRYNKPVALDGAVNSAVYDWCQRAGLEVKTQDVREPRWPVPIEKERTA